MEDKQLEDALAKSIEQSFNDSELEDIMNEIENLEKEFSEDSSDSSSVDDLSLSKARDNDLQDVIDQEVASVANEMETILDGATDEFEQAAMQVEAQEPVEVQEPVNEQESLETVDSDDGQVMFSEEELASIASDTQEVEALGDETPILTPDPIMEEMQQSQMEAVAQEPQDSQEDQQEVMASIEDQVESANAPAQDNVFEINRPQETQAPANTSSASNIDFNAHGAMDLNINFNVAGQTAQLKVENGGLTLQLNGVELTISEEVGCSVKMAGGVKFSVPLDASDEKKNVA